MKVLYSGIFLTHNHKFIIAVKRFKLSVYAQFLFFYWAAFKKKRNYQDEENELYCFFEYRWPDIYLTFTKCHDSSFLNNFAILCYFYNRYLESNLTKKCVLYWSCNYFINVLSIDNISCLFEEKIITLWRIPSCIKTTKIFFCSWYTGYNIILVVWGTAMLWCTFYLWKDVNIFRNKSS